MQQIFVELYNYRPEWSGLSIAEREAFVGSLAGALGRFRDQGVEVVAYGVNDLDTDRRAPYDFFCVYRVPDVRLQRVFEAQIAGSGWYRYFEQVNISGAALSPAGTLMKNVILQPAVRQGEPIAAAQAYQKQSAIVLGHTMSYIDVGHGRPVVFLHGDIMSSFLWHNVIPYVSAGFRAIAVDLIGAGDSSKIPGSGEGTYSFGLHAKYLGALLDTLDLGDEVILVGHDWGANLAFDWAIKNEGRVRGIAFTEALLPPFDWSDWPLLVREPFRYMRSPEGGRDVLDNNYFLHAARDNLMRVLEPAEWAEIERPYAQPGEDRRPTLDWPRAVPFGDDDTPVRAVLEHQAAWLANSAVPKLHLAGAPGGIEAVGGRRRDTIATFPNLTVGEVAGLHWTPLDDPHAMGEALAAWLAAV